MVAAAASAALIVAGSLVAGQGLLALAGRREWTLLAGPVGLAMMLALAGIVAGIGGRGAAIAIALGLLVAAGAAAIRWGGVATPVSGHPAWPAALVAAALAALAAAIPFIAAGRVGILGMGLVNDDMAYHLLMADWVGERFTPEPELIGDGYPLGPHGMVAGLSALLGASSIDVFAGLVLAIPALTALVVFAALRDLGPPARAAVAALVAVPYLAAAYLAQAAFKEPIMVLFLVGFALLLAERSGAPVSARGAAQQPGGTVGRYRWARGIALGAIAAGTVYVYSFPGLAWLGGLLAIWALLSLWRGRRASASALRELTAAAAPTVLAGLLTWVVITLPDLGRMLAFTDFRALDPESAHEGGLGNLRGHLSPLQVLGIWPTSEFRLRAGAGGIPAAAFYAGAALAAGGLALGLARWTRRYGPAIPAALATALVAYLGARAFGTVYSSAKALAIAAPLVALVTLGGLLGATGLERRALPRLLLAAAIGAGMVVSSFLVLRQAPVGPETQIDELAEIRPLVAGEPLLFFGRDNFVLYGLRGSRPHVHVRHFYNPHSVAPDESLERVRAKFDFDSVEARTLARFPYVLTTRAAYASGPPPGYEALHETAGYVLWARAGDPTGREAVEDDLAPGALLECRPGDRPGGGARAAWLPRRPVAAGDGDWLPAAEIEDGSPATVELDLPAGDWELSLQYHATADVALSGPGVAARLPASLGYRGALPFWPAGRVEGHPGGPLTVEAAVAAPPLAGRLLGVRTLARLGTLAATPAGRGYGRAADTASRPFPGSSARLGPARRACGRYADWVAGG